MQHLKLEVSSNAISHVATSFQVTLCQTWHAPEPASSNEVHYYNFNQSVTIGISSRLQAREILSGIMLRKGDPLPHLYIPLASLRRFVQYYNIAFAVWIVDA
jgi:hypothetical protein